MTASSPTPPARPSDSARAVVPPRAGAAHRSGLPMILIPSSDVRVGDRLVHNGYIGIRVWWSVVLSVSPASFVVRWSSGFEEVVEKIEDAFYMVARAEA